MGRAVLVGAALLSAIVVGSTSAAAMSTSSSLPRCKSADYDLELATLRHSLSSSSTEPLGLTVGIVASDRLTHACALRRTSRVAVQSSTGQTLPSSQVEGNNATWHISTTLRPWGQTVHTWVWHNWCGSSGDFRVRAVLSDGQSSTNRVSSAPRCEQAGTPSALVDRGPGTRHIVGFSRDGIPAHILPKGTPPPLPADLITPANAWLVSDGYTLVAVYAGHAGQSVREGMFAVVRQNLVFGLQYTPPAAARSVVYLGKVGAARITVAPTGRRVETSAQHGRLHFRTSSGAHGVFNLARDTVTFAK